LDEGGRAFRRCSNCRRGYGGRRHDCFWWNSFLSGNGAGQRQQCNACHNPKSPGAISVPPSGRICPPTVHAITLPSQGRTVNASVVLSLDARPPVLIPASTILDCYIQHYFGESIPGIHHRSAGAIPSGRPLLSDNGEPAAIRALWRRRPDCREPTNWCARPPLPLPRPHRSPASSDNGKPGPCDQKWASEPGEENKKPPRRAAFHVEAGMD
jgi:hypothetical protein